MRANRARSIAPCPLAVASSLRADWGDLSFCFRRQPIRRTRPLAQPRHVFLRIAPATGCRSVCGKPGLRHEPPAARSAQPTPAPPPAANGDYRTGKWGSRGAPPRSPRYHERVAGSDLVARTSRDPVAMTRIESGQSHWLGRPLAGSNRQQVPEWRFCPSGPTCVLAWLS